jgi:hypothetical protein
MWLEQLFMFKLDHSASDRNRLLLSLFGRDDEIRGRLPLLNALWDIKMPLFPPDSEVTTEQREERSRELIVTVRVRNKNFDSECAVLFNER